MDGLGYLYSDDYGYYEDGMDAFGDLFVDRDYLGGGGSGWDDQAWFVGNDDLPTFDTDPWFAPIETIPDQALIPNDDLYFDYLNDFLGQGYDVFTADQLAQERASEGVFERIITEEQGPVQLPDISWPVTSYVPDQWALPPFVPIFEDFTIPPPPPPPPVQQQPKLPGACPAGQYHPYPIGHPQQDVCVPFPAPPRPQQQQPRPQQTPAPRPPAQQGSRQQQQQPTCPTYCKHPQTGQWYRTPSGYTCAPVTQTCTPISQQQQACPTGQVRNPTTGQCVTVPQCTTPGTVFDARAGRCVPYSQAQQPLCPPGYWPNFNTKRCEPLPTCEVGLVFDVSRGLCVPPSDLSGDLFADLKNIPWWAWAALAALLLLDRDKEESGKKVTIQHRRAS